MVCLRAGVNEQNRKKNINTYRCIVSPESRAHGFGVWAEYIEFSYGLLQNCNLCFLGLCIYVCT